jgi:predicted SPOUT superfamily RNA methylase MTH1
MSYPSTQNKKLENSSKLEKKQQIPTEYNEEQTLRTIRKQAQIDGETRTKTINDFPYTAAIAQVLKELKFPADKEKIINFLLQQQSKDPQSREILSILQQIDEKREFNNIADITKAAGLVE